MTLTLLIAGNREHRIYLPDVVFIIKLFEYVK